MIVLIMGVSGCGKSTVAAELVRRTGWVFAEGDDYHSAANKAKMAGGTPLTDEDRGPWLNTLHDVLAGWEREGGNGIFTCSALKQVYRDRLFAGILEERIVFLDPPRDVLEERLAARKGHYMNPRLLESQLATLEPPSGPNVLHLTSSAPAEELATEICTWLGV
jgi:gluconokinase